MVNPQLLDYVKQQLAQGLSKETIQHNLASAGGWNLADINEAFATLVVNQPASIPTASSTGVPISSAQVTVKYAGFWIRFVAINVDMIIVFLINGIIQLPLTLYKSLPILSQSNPFDPNNINKYSHSSLGLTILSEVLGMLIIWAYFSLMTYYKGATLGKMLVGITVKSDSLEKLSFGRVLLRETVGKLVSQIILGIGYIIAGVTQNKQALHDMFAHSVVVYKDPSKPHTTGLVIGIIIAFALPLIAIMGILSSVVLVSLNVARQKGNDAQVHSVLMEMRTQAEIYYGNNNSYSVARDCSSGMFADSAFASTTQQLKDKSILNCFAEKSTYAISTPLSSTGTSTPNYCVDSTGFSGDAVATDDGSKAICVPVAPKTLNAQNITAQNTSSTQIASTGAYSYTLPVGWKIAQNGPQGMQALNQSNGYLLSITATVIPSLYGNITSVDQVTSIDQLKSSLIKKYPNAIIVSASTGTLGDKKTYLMNYEMSAADLIGKQSQGQPQKMSITEYTTVYKGSLYTLAYISALSNETSAQNDLKLIINNFKFN